MASTNETNRIYRALQVAKGNAQRILSRRCSMDEYDEAKSDLQIIQDGLDALESICRAN